MHTRAPTPLRGLFLCTWARVSKHVVHVRANMNLDGSGHMSPHGSESYRTFEHVSESVLCTWFVRGLYVVV